MLAEGGASASGFDDRAGGQEAVEAAGDEVVEGVADEEEEDEVEVEAGVDDVEDESDLLSEAAGVAGLSALTLPERESLR